MALVKCKQCGNDVATNAAACPKCGAPPAPTTNVGKAVLLGVVGAFGMCFFVTCAANMKTSSGGNVARTSSRPKQAATPVEIRTLLQEYGDNEVRADSSFKNHVIQTSGVVDDVKKDIADTIYITIGTGRRYETPIVQCFFDDAHAGKAASLSRGAKVTVRGRVDGLMLTNVLVQECEFVDL